MKLSINQIKLVKQTETNGANKWGCAKGQRNL